MNDVKFVPHPKAPNFVNRTNVRYGRLVAIGYVGKGKWLCWCDCSNQTVVHGGKLTTGHTQSCGCYHLERITNRNTKHGNYLAPEYSIWVQMKQRCYTETNASYQRYGGRGICVCESWQKSFERFICDMGERPNNKYTIDRIDNDGHYSCGHCDECLANGWPANCRWATRQQQSQNRRNVNMITFQGKTMSIPEWSKETGISTHLIYERIKQEWAIHDVLVTPSDIPTSTLNRRFLSHNGKTMCITDWANTVGIDRDLISSRLSRGWSIEKTLTTPKRMYKR